MSLSPLRQTLCIFYNDKTSLNKTCEHNAQFQCSLKKGQFPFLDPVLLQAGTLFFALGGSVLFLLTSMLFYFNFICGVSFISLKCTSQSSRNIPILVCRRSWVNKPPFILLCCNFIYVLFILHSLDKLYLSCSLGPQLAAKAIQSLCTY